jgi:hypothetical protein
METWSAFLYAFGSRAPTGLWSSLFGGGFAGEETSGLNVAGGGFSGSLSLCFRGFLCDCFGGQSSLAELDGVGWGGLRFRLGC